MSRSATFADAADNGWGGKKRGESDMDLDITPMIDVTFLLLIFFMVSSTMQATPDLDIPPAKHGVGLETVNAMVLIVQSPKSEGEDSVIILENGNEATLEEVTAEVQRQKDSNITQVIIKADGKVPTRFVQQVMNAIIAVEGVGFHIGVRDKKSS